MACWTSAWVVFILVMASMIEKGFFLMCYECISTDHPGCADPFDPWRFRAVMCHGNNNKCATQRQNTNSSHIDAVQRGCYKVGQVSELNDTDGCREWTHPESEYRAMYCFCGSDLCNAAVPSAHYDSHVLPTCILVLLVQNFVTVSCLMT